MSFRVCANLSFMFQETPSLLERYHLAKECGFKAVECAFPYQHKIEEVVEAKKSANVEQVLINVFPGLPAEKNVSDCNYQIDNRWVELAADMNYLTMYDNVAMCGTLSDGEIIEKGTNKNPLVKN
uniref:Hydroxypyruvate isomerase n=1 Tax=Timema bartmani TaxID=61472 RepID=A0A7R9F5G2_9NEOP|nr:unnamed protein product [Timema bartmani]